jgi:hypothetical protein
VVFYAANRFLPSNVAKAASRLFGNYLSNIYANFSIAGHMIARRYFSAIYVISIFINR